jgi:DNA-binding MarR family transcriptional regulator
MMDASITTAQVILLHLAQRHPNSTHSDLARAMKLSASSASQMVERLVKMDFLMR